jgi:hypothetical protein
MDKTIAYYTATTGIIRSLNPSSQMCCGASIPASKTSWTFYCKKCSLDFPTPAVCEKAAYSGNTDELLVKNKTLLKPQTLDLKSLALQQRLSFTQMLMNVCNITQRSFLVSCPCGHVTHSFLSCDQLSHCGGQRYMDSCPVSSPRACKDRLQQWYELHEESIANDSVSWDAQSIVCSSRNNALEDATSASVEMFACDNDDRVHYTLLCDHRNDCPDKSDESFCIHPHCAGFQCRSGQCVPRSQRCDEFVNCLDSSDEDKRPSTEFDYVDLQFQTDSPDLVNLDGKGAFTVLPFVTDDLCMNACLL